MAHELSADQARIDDIIIRGKSETLDCYMLELMGADRSDYLNFLGSRTRYSKSGETQGVKDFSGIETRLIHKSLYDKNTEERVPLAKIESWPSTTLSKLYDMAKDLSGLGDDAEDEEGND